MTPTGKTSRSWDHHPTELGGWEDVVEAEQDNLLMQQGQQLNRAEWHHSIQQQQFVPGSGGGGASPPNDAKMAAVLLCDVLGAFCILLNAFVITALIRNRRRVLANVFYVLVLHCAIVDLIRGGCLIAWGMPHLLIHTMRSMQDRLMALKINQITLVVLRSCNLLTIFNLLVFTTNEFIVINYPLTYRRYFRRRIVLLILALCWLVSLLFGIGSVFSNFFEAAHTVMVRNNGSALFQQMDSNNTNNYSFLSSSFSLPIMVANGEDQQQEEGMGMALGEGEEGAMVTRRQMAGLSINVLCMLMIFVLCYVCLFTVLVCYGKILRTIRQFQKCGNGGGGTRRVLQQTGAGEDGGQRSGGLGRAGSIYHKRSVHQQRSQQQQQAVCQQQQGTPTPAVRVQGTQTATVGQRTATMTMAAGGEEQQQQQDSVRKKASVPGTPQSMASVGAGCGRCPNCVSNAAAEERRSKRCNSHRKWRSHLMSRHKYLIVIGTVLFVDVLFLFPYSGIQMVALLHLNNLLATSHMTTLIRWGLQILIGVHSVCQPLCYFRMTEFRRLACCLGGARRFGGSSSSAGSIFGAGGTFSRSAKSVGSMKAFGLTRDEDGALVAPKRSIVLSTLLAEGPLNCHHKSGTTAVGAAAAGRVEGESGGRQRENNNTNWINPAVGERQMLLIAQRRRWTRNLSLLCKEEGEELEVFLSREFRRKGDPQEQQKVEEGENGRMRTTTAGGSGSRRQQTPKGGSLRDRAEAQADEGGNNRGMARRRCGGSDGKLLERARSRERTLREEEEEEQPEEGGWIQLAMRAEDGGGRPAEDVQGGRGPLRPSAIEVEEADGEQKRAGERRLPAFAAVREVLGRMFSTRQRTTASSSRKGRGEDWTAQGEEEEGEPMAGGTRVTTPFLLGGGWKRTGGTQVLKFRTYGRQTGAELRPKLSDLSGLRSNSVFSSLLSSVQSRQPSAQWGNSEGGSSSNRRK